LKIKITFFIIIIYFKTLNLPDENLWTGKLKVAVLNILCCWYVGCKLDVLSWGMEDQYNLGHIIVNGVVAFDTTSSSNSWKTGVSVGILDYDNCTLINVTSFNTYCCGDQTAAFISYISNVQNGSILVAITSDEPWSALQSAYPILELNGVNTGILGYRGKFAFVSQVRGEAGYVTETRNRSSGNVQLFVHVQGIDSVDSHTK